MYAMPVLAMLVPPAARNMRSWLWLLTGITFAFLIGFRFEVGGDWFSYIFHYRRMVGAPFESIWMQKDPGYAALNWLTAQVDGQIYLVNLVCGAIVMAGVIIFARQQPRPLLALLVAIPYMIVVVAMGYTRQSVALGFELLALVCLMKGRHWSFVLLIIFGALFHKSAVILLPLAALASTKSRLWTWTWVGIVSIIMAWLLLAESQEHLWHHYVERGRVSEGGGIRIAMNAIPAFLFLFNRKWMAKNDYEKKLWTWIAIFSLAGIPLVPFASTAVDRIALYFMPIQMFVFSRVETMIRGRNHRPLLRWGVVGGYALVLWVWLNFASHAGSWLPYRFPPFFNL
ncbi:EpsG family protein [Desulfopila inferna]|uniref:EpsG family protein n=1 Tax=Desulfopila inferna TaxID=468528 RepID=UPI00196587DF|nr:EpsG family protein [Desulfopila inferna]MBM9605794.1 EpsG family protein [Desulfopila inferna]